ncbi:MAG: SDR family oxidoreductase [Bacteroidota bacterium]|jgi:NAD(P)-dependent dehydrogenase (short-subunit alcohol dehydrogenase family)|nr:SDR family oxidoreductase [Bacteroidota bacterium]GIR20899.1 MAG: oxidoreductase [Flavobacteriales bacterium]|tara:strand:+ start:511 stop:1194 length:684 start_codon:yes stop_codon:yes gene_type:complete
MKNIVIIGGTKGIGKAIVSEVVDNNNVVCLSRNQTDFSHDNYTFHNFDALVDDYPDFESVDCLIYCPGSINLKPISTLSLDDFRNDFELNVIGAVRAIKKYLNLLKKSGSASILLFSTVATKLGMPYHASVSVAKSGIDGLVKTLGSELAPKVRINAIAPTITNTELASKILRNDKVIENMVERHPLKKILSSNEVAKMASFLISEDASSISGQIFNMDAGIVSFKS